MGRRGHGQQFTLQLKKSTRWAFIGIGIFLLLFGLGLAAGLEWGVQYDPMTPVELAVLGGMWPMSPEASAVLCNRKWKPDPGLDRLELLEHYFASYGVKT